MDLFRRADASESKVGRRRVEDHSLRSPTYLMTLARPQFSFVEADPA